MTKQNTYRDTDSPKYELDVEELQNQDRRSAAAIDRNVSRQQHKVRAIVKIHKYI